MTALLYDKVYMLPLCLALTPVLCDLSGITQPLLLQCILSTVSLGICVGTRHLKGGLKLLPAGCAGAVAVSLYLLQEKETRLIYLQEHWWVAALLLAGVVSFGIGRLMAQYPMFRRGFMVGVMAVLAVGMYFWQMPLKTVVAAAMFLLLVTVAEEVQLRWQKEGGTDHREHIVYLLPFFLAVSLAVLVLPSSPKPYDWQFAVKLWERAQEGIRLSGNFFHGRDEDFGNPVMDFSEDGTGFGNLFRKNKKVLELSAAADAGQKIYLAGRVMDTFDGRTWSTRDQEAGRNTMLDTLETICAVMAYDPEYVRDYLWEVRLQITYDAFHTKHFLVPEKLYLKENLLGEYPFIQQGGNLLSEKNLGYQTQYPAGFLRLNREQELFREFMQASCLITEDTWDRMLEQRYLTEEEGLTYRDYLNYRQRIPEYYLQEVLVSQELRSYLDRLYEGAESDVEKLERLEKMLKGFGYTLNPGGLPETVDSPAAFLDEFLFNGQEGYCTWFATAFVLLSRAEGIPARFVQGYYVQKNGPGMVEVTTDMAHAWPETWLEGVGWISWEPTPGHGGGQRWKLSVREKQENPSPETKPAESPAPPQMQEIPEELPKELEKPPFPWRYVVLPLTVLTVFLAAALAGSRLLAKRWYAGLTEEEKFREMCRQNLKILDLLGIRLQQGETLAEYGQRCEKHFLMKCMAFLPLYEGVIYGGLQVDESLRKKAEENNAELLQLLKNEKRKFYFWYRMEITGFHV